MRRVFATILAIPVATLLIATCAYFFPAIAIKEAWITLFEAPRLLASLGMTLWTGLASSLLAWRISAWLLSQLWLHPSWPAIIRRLAFMLAVPHAAFAVGLVFLIAPSGWLIRALSPWLTGWIAPPLLATSQDAYGLGLIAMLSLKETPFLLWCAATQLQRDDVRQRWPREAAAAQTLGYSRSQAFWQVIWPQLSTRLSWPMMAVLAYSLTVVDAAIIAGPSSPSTLAVRAWQWLQDTGEASEATGAAAACLLTAVVALCAAAWLLRPRLRYLRHRFGSQFSQRLEGQRDIKSSPQAVLHVFTRAQWSWMALVGIYVMIVLALCVGSFAALWPFPQLWPQSLSLQAWATVLSSVSTVSGSVALAVGSSLTALLWSVAWLECAPKRWDEQLRRLLYLPLLIPGVLWVVGLHRLALALHISGSWPALLLAHVLAVLPYTLITLSPAYQGFDARYAQICASLGKNSWRYLSLVKWPLLRSSLWASFAVGFAVSMAQYLPTLYLGEGRWATITTEAVNLSAGGQRSLVAAYAGLQGLLPALCFALAAWLGQARKFRV